MIRGLLMSLQFFSRIPINIALDFDEKNIRYSIFFMPLVGGLLGGISGLGYYLLAPYNRLVASFIGLLLSLILTGGLHIDGLADTFDGFLSNRDRERTLEIMRDSRIGAFGVLSILIVLGFKLILIYSLDRPSLALILAMANSRLVLSRIIATREPARPEGLGYLFHSSRPGGLTLISSLIYISILALIGVKYLLPILGNYLAALYISHRSRDKIGGLTGDVYGAIIEIGELVSLFCLWGVAVWI